MIVDSVRVIKEAAIDLKTNSPKMAVKYCYKATIDGPIALDHIVSIFTSQFQRRRSATGD